MTITKYVEKVVNNIRELTIKDQGNPNPTGTSISFGVLQHELEQAFNAGYKEGMNHDNN